MKGSNIIRGYIETKIFSIVMDKFGQEVAECIMKNYKKWMEDGYKSEFGSKVKGEESKQLLDDRTAVLNCIDDIGDRELTYRVHATLEKVYGNDNEDGTEGVINACVAYLIVEYLNYIYEKCGDVKERKEMRKLVGVGTLTSIINRECSREETWLLEYAINELLVGNDFAGYGIGTKNNEELIGTIKNTLGVNIRPWMYSCLDSEK